MAKFSSKDHAVVSEAPADAVLATATEGEEGNAPVWRPNDEYASEVLFDAISSCSALSGAGNDRQRFSHLQSTIHTDIGREKFGRSITAFDGESSTSRTRSRKVLAALLPVESHHIGGKVPAGLRGHDVEEALHRRDYATVAAEVGGGVVGGQPRGGAVWGRRTRRSGACKSKG